MAVDLENFAFSFSHGIIRLNNKQYTAISNVSGSQPVERSAVMGTSRVPLKKSIGQMELGEGSVTFSDLEEAMEFYEDLGDEPTTAIFAVDATFTKADGTTKSVEYIGCSITDFSADWESGADALGMEFPFDFMRMKVNGASYAN